MNPLLTFFRLALAPPRHRTRPLRVAGIYLAFGVLWILLSDIAVEALSLSSSVALGVQASKGIAFVLLSAGLLYVVTLREIREVVRATDLLRAVCDGATDAIYVKDRQGRYLLCNPAAAKFVGLAAEEVVGRDDTQLFDSASAKYVQERDQRVMNNGYGEIEEECLTSAGQTRTYLANKSPYRDEAGKVIGLVGISLDITEQKRAEEQLHERESFARAIIETSADGFVMGDPQGRILDVNESYAQRSGYSREQLLTMRIDDLEAQMTPDEVAVRVKTVLEQGHDRFESMHRAADGSLWPVEIVSTYWPIAGGRFFCFCRDITQRKKTEENRRELERQLHQAQKMEAIGLLAGGIAHDFNNVLTVVFGFSDILLSDLPAKTPQHAAVQAIQDAGKKAAELTRQLLIFSRQAVLEPTVLDLNDVVRDTEKLLRRMIGEDIIFTTILAPQLRPVQVDSTQLGQVLMNLAVNARDAMPQGGQLTMTTQDVTLDTTFLQRHTDVEPGPFVLLTVSDTGCGMPPEVMARIFEPFFTTKGPWKGTGIGLATVYGIVQQSGGLMDVQSTVGEGSTFRVYLPSSAPAESAATVTLEKIADVRGAETILLVEDETAVQMLAKKILENQGYQVLTADNGPAALDIATNFPGRIAALVTDVVMPGMSGRQLAEELLTRLPNLKVLYLSGYTDDAVVRHGVQQAEVEFLAKPYTPQVLANKVRQMLDLP